MTTNKKVDVGLLQAQALALNLGHKALGSSSQDGKDASGSINIGAQIFCYDKNGVAVEPCVAVTTAYGTHVAS